MINCQCIRTLRPLKKLDDLLFIFFGQKHGFSIAELDAEIVESDSLSGIPDGATLGTAITTGCALLAGVSAANDFCASADTDSFTSDQLKGARGLFREDTANFGLGECVGLAGACICP